MADTDADWVRVSLMKPFLDVLGERQEGQSQDEKFCCPLLLVGSALFLILCALPAHGQTTGQIAGLVRDQTGAVITGAEITIVSQATGDRRRVTTDGTGRYMAPLLPPGSYHVSIAITGLKSHVPNVRFLPVAIRPSRTES